jgi:hypothetical protein
VTLKRFDVMAYARARIPAAKRLNADAGIVDEAVAQADKLKRATTLTWRPPPRW